MIIKSKLIERFSKEADSLLEARRRGENNDAVTMAIMPVLIAGSQIILFEQEQALAFAEAARAYTDLMDYRPPFEYTLIWFSEPMPDDLLGIICIQAEYSDTEWQITKNIFRIDGHDGKLAEGEEINAIYAIYVDHVRSITWISNGQQTRFVSDAAADADIRNLAIACIGYINCENIRIEPQRTNTATNAKRQRKGKATFDDYYLCRIRGVDYDRRDGASQGSSHGFRYDVRGHFRRLNDGRMTWVRPHLRGLANEIYRPKTYDAE